MKLSLLFVALANGKKCKDPACVLGKLEKHIGTVWKNFYEPDPDCAKRNTYRTDGTKTRVERGRRLVTAMTNRFNNDGCKVARRRRDADDDDEYVYDYESDEYEYEDFVFDPAQPRISKSNRAKAIKQLRKMGNRFHKHNLSEGCENQDKVDKLNVRWNNWCTKLQDAQCYGPR